MPVTDFSLSAMANGNIAPCRAIKGDSSADFKVLQGTAGNGTEGDVCLGISQKGERRDPSNSDGYAAIAGEPILYYGNGAKDVPAQIGASVTAFAKLKCGANGKLVPATTDGDNVVAIAKQSGSDGDIIAVDVAIGQLAA